MDGLEFARVIQVLESSSVKLLLSVLAPMIPAVFFFKYLRNKADVAGNYEGLNVKLSGGFAGYVVLVGVVMKLYPTPSLAAPAPDTSGAEAWRVEGRFDWKANDPIDKKTIQARVTPATFTMSEDEEDRTFAVIVARAPNLSNELEFPRLSFSSREVNRTWISFEQIELDALFRSKELDVVGRRTIRLRQPVVLTAIAASDGAREYKPKGELKKLDD